MLRDSITLHCWLKGKESNSSELDHFPDHGNILSQNGKKMGPVDHESIELSRFFILKSEEGPFLAINSLYLDVPTI